MYKHWKTHFDLAWATIGLLVPLFREYDNQFGSLIFNYSVNDPRTTTESILLFCFNLFIIIIIAYLLDKFLHKWIIPSPQLSRFWLILIIITPYAIPYFLAQPPQNIWLSGLWGNFESLILFGYLLARISKSNK